MEDFVPTWLGEYISLPDQIPFFVGALAQLRLGAVKATVRQRPERPAESLRRPDGGRLDQIAAGQRVRA